MSRPEPNTYLHPNYRGWHNAPPFRCYAAAQWGGDGAVFFGVKFNGEVVLTIEDPRAGWSPWIEDWSGPMRPRFITKLGAVGHQDGLQAWGIDDSMQLWSVAQDSNRLWGNWEGPNWNNAPPVHRVVAAKLGGTKTAAVWAITATDYSLISCYKEAGAWSPWSTAYPPPQVSRFTEITAAQQGNGCAAFWALDTRLQLGYMFELTPGGAWSGWLGPDWNSAPLDWDRTGVPFFNHIAACQQGGARGAMLFAIAHVNVKNTHQETAGGNWSAWSTGLGKTGGGGRSIALAAAQQHDGTIRLWSTWPDDLSLCSVAQTSAGGEWGKWWTPWSPQ